MERSRCFRNCTFSLGCQVTSTNNNVIVLANAVENHWWRGRGAHVDGLTIPTEGWNFRTPSGFLESLLVYSYGEIQPDVETTYFPRPFPEADLSLLPEGKWGGNLSEGAESLFWHAASSSNSLILTWQNAAYNRDANCPTNLQIELFSNGTYVYRYDDRTEYHSVAYPFDWDMPNVKCKMENVEWVYDTGEFYIFHFQFYI